MSPAWLPLTDYSLKYKVSVSTLRRRIKTEDIQFQFNDGKYMILDEPPTLLVGSPPARAARPSLKSTSARDTEGLKVGSKIELNLGSKRESRSEAKMDSKAEVKPGAKLEFRNENKRELKTEAKPASVLETKSVVKSEAMVEVKPEVKPENTGSEQKILEVANNLLSELKKAYSQILQEKEEQIIQLKEEIADLKTLVRVLEGSSGD